MLCIGKNKLASPFILAPLAGFTDLPFRLLCREFGAGLCVSEMISCHGLVYQQKKTFAMLASDPKEKPVSFQLFGADPEYMTRAAALLNEYPMDFIDINMGCPVKKVTKKGAGAALMQQPDVARKIIAGVVHESRVPVTVKIRSGVDATHISAQEFALMAEETGAVAVAVHGRTWKQGFSGTADWQVIKAVKQRLTVPVIGNGDITSWQQGMNRMQESGCDGIMIGRSALGNPWVFQEQGKPDTIIPILETIAHHLDLMESHLPVERMLGAIKNHIGRYFASFPGAAGYRKLIFQCGSFTELKDTLAVSHYKNNPFCPEKSHL